MTSEVIYLGNLRTECTHLKSGQSFITDAPIDNNGKGEAISPTDMAATSLAACMITVMGIRAKNDGIDMDGSKASVTKIMAEGPRRISGIQVNLQFPKNQYSTEEKDLLTKIALNCPVAKSLHPDINQEIKLEF